MLQAAAASSLATLGTAHSSSLLQLHAFPTGHSRTQLASPISLHSHSIPAAIPPDRSFNSSFLPAFPTGSRKPAPPPSITTPRSHSVIRSSALTTKVQDVTPAAKELYANVTLALSDAARRELESWYTTPGQYVDLHITNSPARVAAFFIVSAPKETASGCVEFLIHDVPDSTAHELINSAKGTPVELTTLSYSHGFDVQQLYPVQDVETVLLFASSYGLGAIRALIEEGFEATKRRDVKLYHFFGTPDQQPYKDKYPEWEKSGVTVIPCPGGVIPPLIISDPSKTCAALCASKVLQEAITSQLLIDGVPSNKILTVFGGYSSEENTKVETTSNESVGFLKMGPKYIPCGIKITA